MFDKVEDALFELKNGKIIVLCDSESRENEGDFVSLAEFITPESVNFMITHGRGLLCMPLGSNYIEKLQLHNMVSVNTDNFKTAFTVSIDHISNTTGISAKDRATTIKMAISDLSMPDDFRKPGHIFPLVAKQNGLFERMGHTEACIDLAHLCGMKKAAVLCEIMNKDGTMARRKDLSDIAAQHKLKIISIADILEYRKQHDILLKREVTAKLPTRFGEFNIVGYSNTIDNYEHIALVSQKTNNKPMVRLHSECLTGDVFHSLKCDCGEQLETSLKLINKYGGALIYLRQEGRGIGLINKLMAYNLQESGADTVDANKILGFTEDSREYFLAAQMLRDLDMKDIQLITNNPDKLNELTKYGINATRFAVNIEPNKDNQKYLETKINKLGHLISG